MSWGCSICCLLRGSLNHEFPYHSTTASVPPQPFSFSNRNSGHWAKPSSFAGKRAMRFATSVPGVGTRLTHQYRPTSKQDLTGGQRLQRAPNNVHSIWLATAACQVFNLGVSLCLIKIASDGDPTSSQDRLIQSCLALLLKIGGFFPSV